MHLNQVSLIEKKKKVTDGSIAKGEESPTRPPVNEAAGAWMLNPRFLSKKASPLSKII